MAKKILTENEIHKIFEVVSKITLTNDDGTEAILPADGKTFVKESDFTPKQWKAVTTMNAVRVVEPAPTEKEKDEIVFEEIQ